MLNLSAEIHQCFGLHPRPLSREDGAKLSCDPGQAAVTIVCPYLAVRRCSASSLPHLLRLAGKKQETDRNCLLVCLALRLLCVLRLDQETVAVLLSTLQLLRSL
jgi:hypothetical protein